MQYTLHVYPVGMDDVSHDVRVVEVALDPSFSSFATLNVVAPRDSVFNALTTFRRLYHDVVVHTVATTP